MPQQLWSDARHHTTMLMFWGVFSSLVDLFMREVDLWHRSKTNSGFDHRAAINQNHTWTERTSLARASVCDSTSHSSKCVAQVLILTASTAKQHQGAYITHKHTRRSRTNHTVCASWWKKLSCEVLGCGLEFFLSVGLGGCEVVVLVAAQSAAVMSILCGELGQINKWDL